MENKKDNKRSLPYVIGEVFAALIASCLGAIIIAVTIRLVSWIAL